LKTVCLEAQFMMAAARRRPPWCARCRADPDCLPPRPARVRVGSLRWDQVDLHQGLLHVARRKHGIASVHPLRGPELRVLRRPQRAYPDTAYVFVSERKAPLCADAVRKIVARAGREAGIEFLVHPTCCATPPATSWPTTGRTRGRSSIIWGTATFSIPPATPNWRQIGSRISGAISPRRMLPWPVSARSWTSTSS
jgi:Phage integrase family